MNDSQNTEFLKYFCSKISSDNNVEKVIFGDFNCPDISWLSGNVAGPADTINKSLLCQQSFLDIVHEYGLSWLITNEITRRRKVENVVQESTIDQVLNEITECIPCVKPSNPDRIDNYNMPWINSSLKRAIRNKSKTWAAFDNCPSISSLSLALSKQDIYANLK